MLELSNHDAEILCLLGNGITPAQIADHLKIESASVYKAIERIKIRNKLDSTNQLMFLFGKQHKGT